MRSFPIYTFYLVLLRQWNHEGLDWRKMGHMIETSYAYQIFDWETWRSEDVVER
jgi:hypothetical protein